MTGFVVDASMAASWFLPDEANGGTNLLAERAEREAPLTPGLFRHEMRSLFVMAVRRKRGARDDLMRQLDIVERLFAKDEGPGDARAIVALAFKHGLTSYDATYLALALERGAALATLDRALAAAARKEGVEALGTASG